MDGHGERKNRGLLVLGTAVCTAIGWHLFIVLPALTRSYWIDEIGTARTISGSFGVTWERSLENYESPFYFLISWSLQCILGKSEVVLRLFSVFTTWISIFLFFSLLRRKVSVEAGLVAACCLLLDQRMISAASDARPYGLGVCMFSLFLMGVFHWQEHSRVRDAMPTSAAAGLSIACHPFFAIPVACVLIAVVISSRNLSKLVVPGLMILIVILPLIDKLVFLWSQRRILQYADPPDTHGFLYGVVPYFALAGLCTGIVASRSLPKIPPEKIVSMAFLMFVLFLVPPTVMFLLSHLAGGSFFFPRYFIASAFGSAGMVAICTTACWKGRGQLVIPICALLFTIVGKIQFPPQVTREGWREAAEKIESRPDLKELPILLWSGYAEADAPSALTDAAMLARLKAPLRYYAPGRSITVIPGNLSDPSLKLIAEQAVQSLVNQQTSFLLIERYRLTEVEQLTDARSKAMAGSPEFIGNFDNVHVVKYAFPKVGDS